MAARRPWIRGGNTRTEGARMCLTCKEGSGRVSLAEAYDFELLHSLCGPSAGAPVEAPSS